MWYVIQVKTGEEKAIAGKINGQQIRALVPAENRPIRNGGSWTKREYILFPGYVFLDMEYTAWNYYRIKDIPGVIQFLGDKRCPSRLSYLEAEWIRLLGGDGKPLEPTLVREDDKGNLMVVKGILAHLESRITRLDKRNRKAVFEITVCGEVKTAQLGIEMEENPAAYAGGSGTANPAEQVLKEAT